MNEPITVSETTLRYWRDPAPMDAERDAVNAAYFANADARRRDMQEAYWDLEEGLEA